VDRKRWKLGVHEGSGARKKGHPPGVEDFLLIALRNVEARRCRTFNVLTILASLGFGHFSTMSRKNIGLKLLLKAP